MAVLDEISESIEGLVERVGPAVVGLGRGWGRGSGVVTAAGQVLTNAHNLRGDTVTVTFGDGRSETGTVAGVDVDADVAVVSVDTGEVEPVEWPAEGDSPAIGRAVFALANPGGRGLRVTFGLVSAAGRSFRGPRGRRIRGSIEHSAPLPRGSSGGPLVDAEGRLLGLNTVRMDGGLILAIAADRSLRERADALGRGESTQPARLGVAIAPPRVARRLQRAVGLPERDGLLVRAVEDGSPADRAGIEKGDLIVTAGDREVTRLDDMHQALDEVRGGRGELELTVVRGTEERKVNVSFAVVV